MPTNLLINDSLMREALRLGGHSTKGQKSGNFSGDYDDRK